ncbi:MAG: pyridoxal-phosphate dependent enzyme [Anaerolineales bacterium]
MIPYEWIEQANKRIDPFIKETPLTFDEKRDLYLKWENHQVTGSFKVRGAFNKIYSLQNWELERGLVTASAGNHGQGIALAAKMKQVPVIVFASEHALEIKLQAMRELGAEIHLIPGGYGDAEHAGISYAQATGATWVSPYNDGMIIAGQGTIALELLNELPDPSSTTWIVPAGGGGLISGIGCVIQSINPKPRLVAVQSDASPFLHEIYHHGSQAGVNELPSIADGLAGPVEEGSVTIPLVKNYVTDFILVSELEIRKAIKYAWQIYHERIEGSAAASLAAVISGKITSKPALVILTGGNITPEEHARIIRDPSL